MMAQQNEAEFVLERLCESLVRYLRRNPPKIEFADRVKEQGEQALRLRSGWTEEEGSSQTQPTGDSDSIKYKKSKPMSKSQDLLAASSSKAGDLHPVEEEDHDHKSIP